MYELFIVIIIIVIIVVVVVVVIIIIIHCTSIQSSFPSPAAECSRRQAPPLSSHVFHHTTVWFCADQCNTP